MINLTKEKLQSVNGGEYSYPFSQIAGYLTRSFFNAISAAGSTLKAAAKVVANSHTGGKKRSEF